MRRLAREGIATPATLVLYYGQVRRSVRRELAAWTAAAQRIPDPELRRLAVLALTEKGSNAEAVAVFATLAPRRTRAAATRAVTALQVAIDYLDSLGEQPTEDPLRDGLRLHGALGAALAPAGERDERDARHPERDGGGYLDSLIAACRAAVAELPSWAAVGPAAGRAAVRCGEGQSHTHAAAASGSSEALRAWASSLTAPADFRWSEVAAGASSSVAAHALIALAAAPGASAAEAGLVDAAYFPAIGALTVLLDDLVDREADAAAAEHNYLDHYPSGAVAAERIEAIAERAADSLPPLRRSGRHAAILTGVLAYYLSSPAAETPFARPIRERLLASSGPQVRLLTALLRSRNR